MNSSLQTGAGPVVLPEHLLLAEEGMALVAVSGGLDSTCLAHLLAREAQARGFTLVLAHAQHGLRPEDAEAECAQVEAMAARLGLELRVGVLQIDERLRRRVGLEAAARAARFAWLQGLADELSAEAVYLGHHRDDQLETILLRLDEGQPSSRAGGMAEVRGLYRRPLLAVTRAELEQLALSEGWSWVEDPSNRDMSFRRNHLRHVDVPANRAADGAWADRVLGAGELAASEARELDARASRVFAEQLEFAGSTQLMLSRRRLAEAALQTGPATREAAEGLVWLLQRLCRPELEGDRGPGRRALGAVAEAILCRTESGTFSMGAGWSARLDRDWLELRRGAELLLEPGTVGAAEGASGRTLRLGEGITWSGGIQLAAAQVTGTDARALLASSPGSGQLFAAFDLDGVVLPLQVEPSGLGKSIQPFGLSGRRKVRDLLSENRIPRASRGTYPLVIDAAGDVLWIPGVRASGKAPVGGRSTEALILYTVAPSAPTTAAFETN